MPDPTAVIKREFASPVDLQGLNQRGSYPDDGRECDETASIGTSSIESCRKQDTEICLKHPTVISVQSQMPSLSRWVEPVGRN